jgi:hypothetical protein
MIPSFDQNGNLPEAFTTARSMRQGSDSAHFSGLFSVANFGVVSSSSEGSDRLRARRCNTSGRKLRDR